jgi:hypothetical protein
MTELVAGDGDAEGQLRDSLRQALIEVLAKGRELASDGNAKAGPAEPSAEDLARRLAQTPEVEHADRLALELAKRTRYALRHPGGKPLESFEDYSGRPVGRALDAKSLQTTGVAGLLQTGEAVDDTAIADELIGYLAGPAVPIYLYAGLNADIQLSAPLLVAEWELVTPSADELRSLLPLPSLTPYQPSLPWSPSDWAGLAFLRSERPDARPITGLVISFPRAHPEWTLWRPLLALSVCTNDVIKMWSEHLVEPGRYVHTRFENVAWNIIGGPDEELEVPWPTTINITRDQEEQFRRMVTAVARLLPAEQRSDSGDKQYKTLRLAAEHFLAAGQYSYGQATPIDSEHEPEALLHYVIVLEALLSEDDREVSRKVAQRTAVLAGRDDADRLAVYAVTRDAYNARSKYAHGVLPKGSAKTDLETLRDVVRRVLLSRLILGHTPQTGPEEKKTLVQLCDEALLSTNVRDQQICGPVAAFKTSALSPSNSSEGPLV